MKEITLRTSMKNWSSDEQPREKMECHGRKALSNAELLSIVLRTGTKKYSALDLAKMILQSVDNDLTELSKKSLEELKQFPGIGSAKAAEVMAVMELVRRKKNSSAIERTTIKSSKNAYDLMAPYFMDLNHEEFYAMYLNRGNRVLKVVQISRGGVSGTVADGKLIFNYGLESKASAIILAHNHPSGNAAPSLADLQLTQSLKKFGAYIDVQILDHLIIAGDTYYSFADEGKL